MGASMALAADANVMVHGGGRTTGRIDQSHLDRQRGERSQGSGRAEHADSLSRKNWRRQVAGFSRIGYRVAEITSESSELVVLSENRVSWAWFSGSGSGTRFLMAGTAGSSEDSRHGRRSKGLVGDRPRLVALHSTGDQPRKEADHSADNSPSWPVLHQYSTDGWQALDAPCRPESLSTVRIRCRWRS